MIIEPIIVIMVHNIVPRIIPLDKEEKLHFLKTTYAISNAEVLFQILILHCFLLIFFLLEHSIGPISITIKSQISIIIMEMYIGIYM